MRRMIPAVVVPAFALALAGAGTAIAQTAGGRVYLTPEQALVELFGRGVRAEGEPAGSGETTYRVYGPDGALRGYAMVLEEKGKYRPITFLVGTNPTLAVEGVEVLVYREDRGGEVRHARFLRQYEGKTIDDPIRTHRDIVNITGATISVNALNAGVRRALETLARAYADGGHARR
jgi:hypothetical protein